MNDTKSLLIGTIFVIFCLLIVIAPFAAVIGVIISLARRRKQKKMQNVNEVMDYAKNSALYHQSPVHIQQTSAQPYPSHVDDEMVAEFIKGCKPKKKKPTDEATTTDAKGQKKNYGIFLLCAIVFILFSFFGGPFALLSMLLPLLGICGLKLVVYCLGLDFDYSRVLYQKLLPALINDILGSECSYPGDEKISSDELFQLNCFKYPVSNVHTRGPICGTYQGVAFRCGYGSFECEHIKKKPDGTEFCVHEELFSGILVSIPFRKRSGTPLGLCPNSSEEIYRSVNKKTIQRPTEQITGTESRDFNELYTIHSTNEQNLFYILTPDIMEKIAALYTHGDFICFYRDRLYLGIAHRKDYLRPGKIMPNKETLLRIQDEFRFDLLKVREALDDAISL
ncbi:MAG: DUF3137 domain-containing protein [Lachnospiraceae bacterium]